MSGCKKIEGLEKFILWQTQYLQKLPFQISYQLLNFRFLISLEPNVAGLRYFKL